MQQGHEVPSFRSFRPEPAEQERSEKRYPLRKSEYKIRHQSLQKVPKDPRNNKDISALEKAEIPAASELFVIDRKGDQNAARYGPSKYNTPKYSTGMLSSLTKGHSTSTSRHSKRRKSDTNPERGSAIVQDNAQGDAQYININGEEDLKKHNDVFANPQSSEDKILRFSFAADSPQERSRMLHERIDSNAQDTNAWIELVHLQWSFIGADTASLETANETTLAYMELAVLDRALNASLSNRHSLPLLLEQIKVASNAGIWDENKVNDQWHELLTWTTHSLESLVTVWHAFLQHHKSSSSRFRVDDTLRLYSDALGAMQAAAKDTESLSLDTYRLDLIRSLSHFLRSAGYTEWGTAILQAELEILACAAREGIPSNLDEDALLDLFCVWWDDDQCHMSDHGDYRGFSHATWKRPAICLDQKWEEIACSSELNPTDGFMIWRQNELEHGKRLQPRDITTTEGCPDPYSFILAADIRDFLFIPASYPPRQLIQALDIFSEYMGMPQNWIWQTVNFGYPASPEKHVEYIYPAAYSLGHMGFAEDFWTGISSSNPFSQQYIMKMPCSIDVLFPRATQDPRGQWFTIIPKLNRLSAARVERCLLQVMNQQIPLKKSPEDVMNLSLALPLAVLYAAGGDSKWYVFRYSPSSRRMLKNQLRETPDALPLWLAYIQLELCTWGNDDTARKALVEVLSLPPKKRLPMDHDCIFEQLWALWIELEWSMGSWDICWQVIKHAITSGFRYSHSRIQISDSEPLATEKLYIMRSLAKITEPNCSQTMVKAIAEHMSQNVPVGEDLQASLQLFLDAFNSATAFQSQLLAGKCLMFLKMAQCAAKRSKIRTRDERAVMTKLLDSFPDDTRFLCCLGSVTRSDKLNKHVRNVMELFLKRNIVNWTAFHWLELILTEVALGGSIDRIRAHFDRALHIFPYSEQLWKTVIAFEVRNLRNIKVKRYEYNRIKSVVYQGIKYCPYSRDLLFMAMDPALDHIFTQKEWFTLIMTAEEHQIRFFEDPPLLKRNDNG